MFRAASRTNWFRVNDRAAFDAALLPFGSAVRVYDGVGADAGKVMLTGEGHDEGGFPDCDELTGDPVDFGSVLAAHLPAAEVLVLISAGSDRLREVAGYARAYNAGGDSVEVSLDSIYDLAERMFGQRPSLAAH